VISLLVIVAALLVTNLYALTSGRTVSRIPFAVAVVALSIAFLGPFAGVLHVPLPSQFLLLWLLVIPIAVICAIAATLLGLLGQTRAALSASSPQTRLPSPVSRHLRWTLTALPVVLVVVVAALTLVTPVRLLRAPVQGIETSTGTVLGDSRYGASFTAEVSGSVAGSLTVFVNYRPAYPRPGITHVVAGGTWSLAVHKDGHYQGTVFGPVGGGTLHWNLDVTEGTISAVLNVAGGTGTYLGVHGRVYFTGSLLHTTYPPTISGETRIEIS
jgi:hypothetical protein